MREIEIKINLSDTPAIVVAVCVSHFESFNDYKRLLLSQNLVYFSVCFFAV